ncbi:MAG: hypothetical protein WC897_02435 [Candidatus Gracilibacteria bacterium]
MKPLKIFQIFVPVLLVTAVIIAVTLNYIGGSTIVVSPSSLCIEEGKQQQFEASQPDVMWSLESSFQNPTTVLGTIDQNGLFTALKSGLGQVVATKNGAEGYAIFAVIPAGGSCNISVVDEEDDVDEDDVDEDDEEEGADESSANLSEDNPFFGDSVGVTNKWLASFDVTMNHDVINDSGKIGDATYNLKGEFKFTVDYATGEITLVPSSGLVEVKESTDVSECSITPIGEAKMSIVGIDAKLQDMEFVFGPSFITTDHKEGMKMACLSYNFTDENASLVDLIAYNAFPVTVDAIDGRSSAVQGFIHFADTREAKITGTMTVSRVNE